MKLDYTRNALALLHPALDVVQETLYVTVRANTEKGPRNVVLTSEGTAYDMDEWKQCLLDRGLESLVEEVNIGHEMRWNTESMQQFLDDTLIAPTWKEAYDAIYTALDAHLVLRDRRYLTVLTLFSMMTYIYPLFDTLPILHLRGPAESGKSRAGDALSKIAFNGALYGTPTASTIFRRAHEGRYTQIIAECDQLAQIGSGHQFAQQLQTSCRKAEATVVVAESRKDKPFTPVVYYTFTPRVLLSTTPFKSHPLRSRCIRLDLVKVPHADETKLRKTLEDDTVWAPLRDMQYRLQLLYWKEVREKQESAKTHWKAATGRTFDKWLPLATIAALVSPEVLHEVSELARESQEEQKQDAEVTFEGLVFKFAGWVVKEGDVELTEDELYRAFLGSASESVRYTTESYTPHWARETDTTIESKQLTKWIKGRRHLTRELKRLDLIPKQPHKHNDHNRYEIKQDHVKGIVGMYLDDSFFQHNS